MTSGLTVPVTQRAYTLRLRGIDANDESWRDALWATHEAVNRGARAFGDWLLTLRGGLDHSLATAEVPATTKKPARSPTARETQDRKIVLALSWLSVEDARHAPPDSTVALGTEPRSTQSEKSLTAFRDILRRRGLQPSEIDDWLQVCSPSLCSTIREDAAWVNRSRVFDSATHLPGLTRAHAQSVLEEFTGATAGFLSLPATENDDRGTDPEHADEPKDFVEKAGAWLSFNCGEDDKSDKAKIATNLTAISNGMLDDLVGKPGNELLARILSILQINDTSDSYRKIRDRIGWLPSRDSKGLKAIRDACSKPNLTSEDIARLMGKLGEEATERRVQTNISAVPWAGALRRHLENIVGFGYAKARFAVMLDHALRRLSSTHSSMKRAEAKRTQFEEDAAKIDRLNDQHRDAVDWLNNFCQGQSAIMGAGADRGYLIRKRALGGKNALEWKAVVQAWSREDCRTEQDRIDAADEVRRGWDEDDKLGAAGLFERLAAEDAVVTWRKDGAATPQILIDYTAAITAKFDRTRLKVPMYRHPDPLRHPVFCDFGNSRWSVHFEAHKVGRAAGNTAGRRKRPGRDLHVLTLQLLGSSGVESSPFRWASKRLDQDLAIKDGPTSEEATCVTRADRLGRAAARASKHVEVMNVYGPKPWNGRLQAPRRELERIAKLTDRGKNDKAERAKRRLNWLLTFSPRLQPTGPWLDYGSKQSLYARGRDVAIGPKKQQDSWRGLAYPIWHAANEKGRKGLAKHILSRLPGLRVLSIDLGHRFAAACAVWETLSASRFDDEVDSARAKKDEGWSVESAEMYVLVRQAERDSNRYTKKAKDGGRIKRFQRTTVYRRIGPDVLPDGKPHPAPWARLERQFLIKLQGEELPARAASRDEANRVKQLADRYGHMFDDDRQRGRAVDTLMSWAVRAAMFALRRHARRAKIAWALDPATCSVFGMGGEETSFEIGDPAHVDLLTNTLFDWYRLACETGWDDPRARELWDIHVAPIQGGFPVRRDPDAVEERSRQQRRKVDDELRERLRPIAKHFAHANRAAIHVAWQELWQADDGCGAKDIQPVFTTDEKKRRKHSRSTPQVASTGWHAELRWLTDWVMGWHLPGASSKMWTRNVGGLSLKRIATMRSLYQLHKAFAMRARPDKPRGAPEKGESNAGVAQHILDAMERMREQRVKQLASRIAASALGLGGHWEKVQVPKRDDSGSFARQPDGSLETKDRWVWTEESLPKYAPCHAVVIESLTNYRPDELRPRPENRLLMQWSSSKIKKFLAEACQLHGLHLREVAAAYTSQQDSRTGMPGKRCADVSLEDFLNKPWWQKQVKRAGKMRESERNARDAYLVDMYEKWSRVPAEQRAGRVLRIPSKGGDLFVSAAHRTIADSEKPASGIQADLNAAANIGLKALTDPDWPGRWWYIPCNTSDGKPAKDKVAGCPAVSTDQPLRRASDGRVAEDRRDGTVTRTATRGKRGAAKGGSRGEVVNCWRDPSAEGIDSGSAWQATRDYWKGVEERVIKRLLSYQGCEQGIDTATPW